ncbi:MAG: rhomboid family intramembrane serine protease, partial [Armatimonadetes bacterium]|nr:rhomboid family intramembrane serine protease [Armatimonadota bacterium]
MFPLGDEKDTKIVPFVTYTLIALNVLIYMWDRDWHFFGASQAFADLAMRPHEVVRALRGMGDRATLGTLFTSLFLHGNLTHLIGNMIFLLTFGDEVEEALGPWR